VAVNAIIAAIAIPIDFAMTVSPCVVWLILEIERRGKR
jgi:hypothetical protein